MNDSGAGMEAGRATNGIGSRISRRRGRTHGLYAMRRSLSLLTTRRLDGRSAVAVAVRRWKEDVRTDLGGDLSRAQETILEAAAQAWIILSSLDDYIARQPTLVTKKRALLPVVVQRMQIAEGLARNLERLGLERRAKPFDLAAELAKLHRERPASTDVPPARADTTATESPTADPAVA